MSNPWFRMYSEFSHDPKVQMMSEAMQRRYIMFMCLRCSNALVTLHETEIAFHLRISETDMAETKALFIAKGFIDGNFNLLNWEKRQFASDTSNARVAKHRALQKEKQAPACNADVTLPKRNDNALDTDTDTDTEEKEAKASSRATKKCPPSFELSDDMLAWASAECPNASIKTETDKLRDHTFKTARSDWPGTWRNWMRTAHENAASKPKARATPESFKQSDDSVGRARWEEMTGRTHPDNLAKPKPTHGGMVVDVTPKTLELSQ